MERETSIAMTTLRARVTVFSIDLPHCGRDAAKSERKSPTTMHAVCSPETDDFGTLSVSAPSAFSRRALRNVHHSPATGTSSERTRNIGFANLIAYRDFARPRLYHIFRSVSKMAHLF